MSDITEGSFVLFGNDLTVGQVLKRDGGQLRVQLPAKMTWTEK